jgi:hypothetical protein
MHEEKKFYRRKAGAMIAGLLIAAAIFWIFEAAIVEYPKENSLNSLTQGLQANAEEKTSPLQNGSAPQKALFEHLRASDSNETNALPFSTASAPVSSTDTAVNEPCHPTQSLTSEPGGQRVSARIQAGTRVVNGAPNALGLFPRVPIALEETVQVAVSYPGGSAGDLVTVQAEDGGSINGGPPVAQMRLDEVGALRFAFTSTREGGIYRVTLRNGFDEKRLEFWGGPEPTTAAAPSSEY